MNFYDPDSTAVAVITAHLADVQRWLRVLFDERSGVTEDEPDAYLVECTPIDAGHGWQRLLSLRYSAPQRALVFSPVGAPRLTVILANSYDLLVSIGASLEAKSAPQLLGVQWATRDGVAFSRALVSYARGEEGATAQFSENRIISSGDLRAVRGLPSDARERFPKSARLSIDDLVRALAEHGLDLRDPSARTPLGEVLEIYIGPRELRTSPLDRVPIDPLEWSASECRPDGTASTVPDIELADLPSPSHIAHIAFPAGEWSRESPIHGEGVASFDIRCKCGSESFTLHSEDQGEADSPEGSAWADEICSGTLSVRCTACASSWTVHDSAKHGYNARVVFTDPVSGGESVQGAVAMTADCRKCGAGEFRVMAAFENAIDGDKFELADESRGAFAVPDLYDWFFLYARCLSCGDARDWASIETA